MKHRRDMSRGDDIEIICRIRYPELFNRMRESARATALGDISFSTTFDDGGPKLAQSYNLLGILARANIILFVHDDVIFLSEGWDKKIEDAMRPGFNVVGAVGSKKYCGGMIFDSGRVYSAGKVVGNIDGRRVVKLMENRSEIEPVAVVDGMFMAIDRRHFIDTGFDEQFDGLFYYDLDFCLRSNCAVADILIAHEKPDHLRGVYPPDMRPMEAYTAIFNKKHGFGPDLQIGDQRCDTMEYADYANKER